MWKWVKRIFPSQHEWSAQQLSAYLDGELSPSDRERVEAHLKECQTCTEEVRTLRWTVSLAAQMPALKAPRSFLITEAVAQPRRTPFTAAYVYLRSATVAVAALLLLVLASDFLLPYALSPRIPAPPMAVRQFVPAPEELRVEVEAVREVQVTKEVEKRPPTMAPAALEAAEAERPLPEAEAFEQEAEREIGPEAVQLAEEAITQKALPPVPAPAERGPERDVGAAMGAGKAEEPCPAEETPVSLPVTTSTPTSLGIVGTPLVPTPTPSSRYLIPQAQEAVPPPEPSPSRPVIAAAEAAVRPSPSSRSALRLTEVGLGLLVISLVASTLILRARLG